MSYDEAIAYLSTLEWHGIKLGLQNMQTALEAFGNPQNDFHSILVAGTNGKGSTCAFLNQILIENKHKTGFYSSPHLVKYNEHIRVNNKIPSNTEFGKLILGIKAKLEQERLLLSHFEVLTLAALCWFCEKKVEFAVLEVGMGGRLDATNAVNTVANAVTNIGLDHQQHLGNSLREIAVEKAGILKNNAPLLSTEQKPEFQQLFSDLASAKEAKSYFLNQDFFHENEQMRFPLQSMDFKGFGIEWKDLELSLFGRHQFDNASLALAIASQLHAQRLIRLSEAKTRQALSKTEWPARFQTLQQNPPVILDGCHNPDGAKVLAQALSDAFPDKKIVFVFGVSSDKNAQQMLSTLLPMSSRAFFCEARFRKTPAASLATIAKEFLPAFKIKEIVSVKEAVREALKTAQPQEIICICGSLYVAGEALELKWAAKPKKKKEAQKAPVTADLKIESSEMK